MVIHLYSSESLFAPIVLKPTADSTIWSSQCFQFIQTTKTDSLFFFTKVWLREKSSSKPLSFCISSRKVHSVKIWPNFQKLDVETKWKWSRPIVWSRFYANGAVLWISYVVVTIVPHVVGLTTFFYQAVTINFRDVGKNYYRQEGSPPKRHLLVGQCWGVRTWP